jgi:hypothetical protein
MPLAGSVVKRGPSVALRHVPQPHAWATSRAKNVNSSANIPSPERRPPFGFAPTFWLWEVSIHQKIILKIGRMRQSAPLIQVPHALFEHNVRLLLYHSGGGVI